MRRPCQRHGGAIGRVDDPTLLADDAACRGRPWNGIGAGNVSVELPVHEEDLELTALSVAARHFVINCEFLEDFSEGGVFGSRHRREQVVFQLILHASPEPFRKGVGHNGTARGLELSRDPIGLVFVEHFFRLVGGCDDQGAKKTGRENRGQPNPDGKEGKQPGVMDEE